MKTRGLRQVISAQRPGIFRLAWIASFTPGTCWAYPKVPELSTGAIKESNAARPETIFGKCQAVARKTADLIFKGVGEDPAGKLPIDCSARGSRGGQSKLFLSNDPGAQTSQILRRRCRIARRQSSVPLGVREGLTGACPAGLFEECPEGHSPPLRVVFWLSPGSVRAEIPQAGKGRCHSGRRPARLRTHDGPSLHMLVVKVSADTPQPPGLLSSRAVPLIPPRACPSRRRRVCCRH